MLVILDNFFCDLSIILALFATREPELKRIHTDPDPQHTDPDPQHTDPDPQHTDPDPQRIHTDPDPQRIHTDPDPQHWFDV